MALININPNAEVKTGFSAVKAGTYQVRIKEVKNRNPEKNDLEVIFEFTQPASELLDHAGQPITNNVGSLYDYIMLDSEKQWKLRQLVEACQMPWQNFDEQDLVGKELTAVVKIEMYNGEPRNKISRYVTK